MSNDNTEQQSATNDNQQSASEAPKAETEKVTIELDPMECGYLVGVKTDGQLVFQTFGNNPTFLNVLGTHQYATYRVQVATDQHQSYGFPVLAQQLHQVTEMMKILLNMLASQAQAKQGQQEERRIVTL